MVVVVSSFVCLFVLDGSPPLSLVEVNFLVHLEEVGNISQKLTFKQPQQPT